MGALSLWYPGQWTHGYPLPPWLPSGIVGNETWPALIVLLSSGSRGDAVRAVQRQLNARSSSLAVDGVFGPWAGGTGTRPWAPPDNQQQVKNCKHPSVVEPPRYED